VTTEVAYQTVSPSRKGDDDGARTNDEANTQAASEDVSGLSEPARLVFGLERAQLVFRGGSEGKLPWLLELGRRTGAGGGPRVGVGTGLHGDSVHHPPTTRQRYERR
jgi:hypothetical protein